MWACVRNIVSLGVKRVRVIHAYRDYSHPAYAELVMCILQIEMQPVRKHTLFINKKSYIVIYTLEYI